MNYLWQLLHKPRYELTALDGLALALVFLVAMALPFILWNWRLIWEAFKEWREGR